MKPCHSRYTQTALITQHYHKLLQVVLVAADEGDGSSLLAGALNLLGSDCLYGRNWGCRRGRAIKNLHFELCYYRCGCRC